MIVIKPAGKRIPKVHLEAAYTHNRHGFGVAKVEDGRLIVSKTMDFDAFLKMVDTDDSLVAHMRNASAGDVTEDQVHPISIDENQVLFHNGTIHNLCVWNDKESDTQKLARILAGLPRGTGRTEATKAILGGDRAVILHADGEMERFGVWESVDGILYSSDYYKNDVVKLETPSFMGEHFVFVYGSLKMGHYNSHLLEDAYFLGEANTADKFPMVDGPFPYLFDEPGAGHHIRGELYSVDEDTLAELDALEGVDYDHYKRREIDVCLDGDDVKLKVWVYFACHRYEEDAVFIAEWGEN